VIADDLGVLQYQMLDGAKYPDHVRMRRDGHLPFTPTCRSLGYSRIHHASWHLAPEASLSNHLD
jgi:hypothetical protein